MYNSTALVIDFLSSAMDTKIVTLVFVLCCSFATAKELYKIFATGMTCSILDPTIFAKFICKSKNVNRTTNIGFREFVFQPGVILTNYHVKIVLYRKFATIYRQFMVSMDQDVCEMLKNENVPLAKMLNVKDHRKYGNLFDPCPLTGRRYETRAMEFEGLPDILPAGDFRIELTWYTFIDGHKRNISRAQLWGSLKTTTAEQWRK